MMELLADTQQLYTFKQVAFAFFAGVLLMALALLALDKP